VDGIKMLPVWNGGVCENGNEISDSE
jgi:hypothetical protein